MDHVEICPAFKTWWQSITLQCNAADSILKRASRFVHSMEGNRNGALHFCSGDLRQILGIEDEEVSWPLGARSRHNGQQYA